MTVTQVTQTPVAAPVAPNTPPMTRREFLYYIWAASTAIIVETGKRILGERNPK